MYKQNGSILLFRAIVLSQIVSLLPMFLSVVGIGGESQIISLIKYFLMLLSTFYCLKYAINQHIKVSVIQMLFFVWITYLYISAIPNIIDPYRNHIQLKMFLTYIMFLYIIPVMMVAELDFVFLKKLFKFSYVLLLLYLAFALLFAKYDDEGFTILAEGVIILMMTWPYHKPKKRIVVILVFIITIVGMMIAARRNKVVFYGGGLVLALIINIISNSSYGSTKRVILVLLTLVFGISLYFAQSSFSLFFERMGTGMSSREDIIELFVDDFNNHPSDWVFGRGLYGSFYGGVLNTNEDLDTRDGIENGYLFLILKGGGVWLALVTLIAFNALYKGLFKSKNLLCKGFAMIILLYYIDMIGYGVPQISLKYIMVFIAIAGCNTPWLRECSDLYLEKQIGLK